MMKYYEFHDADKSWKIDFLKSQISEMKSDNWKHRISSTGNISYKSELQNFFLDCVNETKKFITRK